MLLSKLLIGSISHKHFALTAKGCIYLLNGFKVGNEEVSVIVGHLVLQDRDQALQTHTRVNALLGQRLQLRLRLSGEGHERPALKHRSLSEHKDF